MVSAENRIGLYIAIPVYFLFLVAASYWAYRRSEQLKKSNKRWVQHFYSFSNLLLASYSLLIDKTLIYIVLFSFHSLSLQIFKWHLKRSLSWSEGFRTNIIYRNIIRIFIFWLHRRRNSKRGIQHGMDVIPMVYNLRWDHIWYVITFSLYCIDIISPSFWRCW